MTEQPTNRQLCELTPDECETAFSLATGSGKPVIVCYTEYHPVSKFLEVYVTSPKMSLFLYDDGAVGAVHLASQIDYPVPINAPALTDYLRSVGIDYPAK